MKNGAMTGSMSQKETLVRLSLGVVSSHATYTCIYLLQQDQKIWLLSLVALIFMDHTKPE
jgi:hypothetical protein